MHTPGGHPVSPIAEEGREDLDLDRMVGDIAKMCGEGGDKLVQKLATQLRDLIAQWDWAQARHRHVAKIVLFILYMFYYNLLSIFSVF